MDKEQKIREQLAGGGLDSNNVEEELAKHLYHHETMKLNEEQLKIIVEQLMKDQELIKEQLKYIQSQQSQSPSGQNERKRPSLWEDEYWSGKTSEEKHVIMQRLLIASLIKRHRSLAIC